MKYIWLLIALLVLGGCLSQQKLPPPPTSWWSSSEAANGGLGFIRSVGIIGIGVVVFFTCWNSMKIYIAAILGIGVTVALATVCMYYEKWFALIMFIALGAAALSAMASLFVKHKGIFLAWYKKEK